MMMSSVHSSQDQGFHLDLEDFLQGLLIMASELVRLHLVIFFHFLSVRVILGSIFTFSKQ